MNSDMETRWTRHEKRIVQPDTRSSEQIDSDERKTKWDRHAEKAAPVPDDMALKNRFERRQIVRQLQTEGTRNRFGDKIGEAPDPKDKIQKPAAWNNSSAKRTGTGRPMDEELIRLREAAEADRRKRVQAKERKRFGLPENSQRKETTADDVLAFLLFAHQARPDIPMDENDRPNDERWYRAVETNARNIRAAWLALKAKGLADLDLAGLLMAIKVCEENNAIDFCKPATRGFGVRKIVNALVEPPKISTEDQALAEAMEKVRIGRARIQRTRLADDTEVAEIKELHKLPFSELAARARSGRKK